MGGKVYMRVGNYAVLPFEFDEVDGVRVIRGEGKGFVRGNRRGERGRVRDAVR